MILPEWLDNISIKIASHDMPATIAFIEEKLKELAPGYPFDYRFLDDEINRRYWAEQTMGTMANYATFITIFISCLGLLGLASYVAERRTKEVGIRKVLGATMSGIVGLLSREFVILVAIAAMVASPAGYFVMDKWLQHFAYHIDIGIWTFLLAAGIALIITIVTVSYQAIRAALANPVDALRYE
jgi:putative ABC transport system permease protein